MRFAGLCVGLVLCVAAAAWANPGLVFVVVPCAYLVAFVYLRAVDRRTAASIDANVRDALARRDRLLARGRR